MEKRVLPRAVKELEHIITIGDMTFTEDMPLGFSGYGCLPFLLSKAKENVLIVLTSAPCIERHREHAIFSNDGFACYVSHYQLEDNENPVILIDMEGLELSYGGNQKQADRIIEAYQKDVLEVFAYALMKNRIFSIGNEYGTAQMVFLYIGMYNLYLAQEDRDKAAAFAKRYMENQSR